MWSSKYYEDFLWERKIWKAENIRHTTAGRRLHYRIPLEWINQETTKFKNKKKKYCLTKNGSLQFHHHKFHAAGQFSASENKVTF